jgi:hypothetical protein
MKKKILYPLVDNSLQSELYFSIEDVDSLKISANFKDIAELSSLKVRFLLSSFDPVKSKSSTLWPNESDISKWTNSIERDLQILIFFDENEVEKTITLL